MYQTAPQPTLYFGQHKGKPLPQVPTGYLRWALATVTLSTGLRAAVRAELLSRGADPATLPADPPPKDVRCRACGERAFFVYWQEARSGRIIRADCVLCGGAFVAFLPQTPANVALADAAQPPAPLLDVLVLAEAEGVTIKRHQTGWLSLEPWGKASPELERLVRQSASLLRRMLT
jgi:hypothetical protein